MDEIYLLYSPRNLGWWTKTSTYSSDISQAKTFTREEALALRKKHTTDGGYNMLPVRKDDML